MKKITEVDGVHKEWYKRAKNMTVGELPEFIRELTKDYEHDYGTIVHAIAAAAVAAAWAVERSPQGGLSGFQASIVHWWFLDGWDSSYNGKPLRLLNYECLLYPQHRNMFMSITRSTWKWVQKEAKRRLRSTEHGAVHPDVVDHWEAIVNGRVPFGLAVEDD